MRIQLIVISAILLLATTVATAAPVPQADKPLPTDCKTQQWIQGDPGDPNSTVTEDRATDCGVVVASHGYLICLGYHYGVQDHYNDPTQPSYTIVDESCSAGVDNRGHAHLHVVVDYDG